MQPPLDDPKFLERFWSKVEKSDEADGCWLWTASLNAAGYGQIGLGGRNHRAHRVSYEIAHGPLAPGYCACHRCDVRYPLGDLTYRRCVRPGHLFSGTNTDNSHDCTAKGRQPHGERNGSRLHPERLCKGDKHYSRVHPERLARGDRNGSRLHPECMARGERQGSAKLTADAVRQIRKMLAGGDLLRVIAPRFGVGKSTVSYIKTNQHWQHVHS